MDQATTVRLTAVGLAEIAARCGVHRQTANNWAQTGDFPPARWTVAGHRAWSWWHDITPWLTRTGRPVPTYIGPPLPERPTPTATKAEVGECNHPDRWAT